MTVEAIFRVNWMDFRLLSVFNTIRAYNCIWYFVDKMFYDKICKCSLQVYSL
jgi:hypothetical protein